MSAAATRLVPPRTLAPHHMEKLRVLIARLGETRALERLGLGKRKHVAARLLSGLPSLPGTVIMFSAALDRFEE
jgi:hypothetical protein